MRVGFYFYHQNIYKQFNENDIFESFLLGIRFDIAAIILVNIPIILLNLLPSKSKAWIGFERSLFIFINTAAFIVGLDDYELFLFQGKRLSYDFFFIADDILEQLPQVFLHYWYLPVVAITFGVLFYFFDRRYFKLKPKRVSWFAHVTSLILLGVFFIGIRGGLQHKSINVQSAFVQGKNELGHLVLNSPYHFLRTLKNKTQEKIKYFATDDEAKTVILNQRSFREGVTGKKNANVVLIILESFSLEYMEKGYTPFLSKLSTKSLFFTHHLANGRRSIEALPSILCGLPSLLAEPLSKSIFSSNKFSCFPKILKEAGYTNHFFHAGARGTMGFEAYALANGFDMYFAREHYGNSDFDGTWGVFDLPYLQYVSKNISKMSEPFLAGVFTLSSHQPYKIPKEYEGKFSKGTLEIHESIQYTDLALKAFFATASKEPWFKNTLFVITSDHTQKLESKKFLNMVGRYRVPLLIYGPGIEGKEEHKIVQHSDIPQTILDYVEVPGEMPATSVSAFSDEPGAAINFADGSTYFLAKENHVYTFDKDYEYDWETGEMQELGENKNPLLKAYVQYFLNGLLNNNLSL